MILKNEILCLTLPSDASCVHACPFARIGPQECDPTDASHQCDGSRRGPGSSCETPPSVMERKAEKSPKSSRMAALLN